MVMLIGGCGTPPSAARLVGVVTVYAPTSLTEILAKLAVMFDSTHSGVDVQSAFGADSGLAQRATTGTGTPVVITESAAVPTGLAAATTPVRVAVNQVVIAVARGNPKGLVDIAALARADLRVALCVPTEPCGATEAALLTSAGVTVPAPVHVPDVRSARAQVEQGSADAALVYRTDTRSSTTLDTVEFPQSVADLVRYQAFAPGGRGDPAIAKAFLDFLTTPAAREALADAGFQLPT